MTDHGSVPLKRKTNKGPEWNLTQKDKEKLNKHIQEITKLLARQPLSTQHINWLVTASEIWAPEGQSGLKNADKIGEILIDECPDDLLIHRQQAIIPPDPTSTKVNKKKPKKKQNANFGAVKDIKGTSIAGRKRQRHKSNTISRTRFQTLYDNMKTKASKTFIALCDNLSV